MSTLPNTGSTGNEANVSETVARFEEMGLSLELLRSIRKYGLQTPTKLQQDTLPLLLKGQDVVMEAPANSGKSTTACISVLRKVDIFNQQCQALILTPSLRTTLRTLKIILALGSYNIHCHVCTDHEDIREDRMRLDKGSHVVVGTPSCVQEIVKHDALTTKNISVVILDRVDDMISGGSKDIIEDLFQSIPRSAQVVFLVSKTFTELKDMAKKFMREPVFISHATEEADLDDSETLTGSVRPSDDKLDETESNQDEKDEALGSFEDMDLNAELLRGITAYGIECPSTFQQRIIQPTLRDQDLIIQGRSGTDKVIAFCISVLQKLNLSNKQCQTLILAPAHEMAQEIQEAILALGSFMGVQCHVCVGGTDVRDDIERLQQGVHVVVGTFGRIQDLVKRRRLRTDSIKMFIMDVINSKVMLDQMEDLVQRFPPGTQMVYLSPRVSGFAMDVMTKIMREPLYIVAKKDVLAVEDVKQFYVVVDAEESKLGALCNLCRTIPATHIVIFCNTPQKIDWLKERLTAREFTVAAIQGSMEPAQREEMMKEFSMGTYRILISTDLLLGDNDVQEVSLVFNFDMPTGKKKYSRRVGLVGRDGNKGVAINIVTEKETVRMKRFEQFYLTPIQEMALEDPIEP